MQILFEWVRTGKNVPVLGKGDNLYQFVHADDLADTCIAAAGRTGPTVYNIGAERFCTMRETLEGLIRIDGLVPAMTGMGVSEDVARLYREMIEAFGSGKARFEGTHKSVRGTTTLAEVLRALS
ncbi:MAG TPA: NAD-dependent epimerase/dehydratase family protein [Polyangiaceae bacterium]|nr:NAD-dependent epimerase/dehydratase family protein [Polyangiaceae bacterium]